MSIFGPPNVKRMKTRRDVQGLIKALNYKEEGVRVAAAEALGALGDPHAIAPLITALGDESWRLPAAAIEALTRIGEPSVVPLIAVLRDNDGNGRRPAASALGQLGDLRAIESLIVALGDKYLFVREAAAEALDRLNWKPSKDAVGATYWIARGSELIHNCVAIGAPAFTPLVTALSDDIGNIREASAKALGQLSDPRAVEPLIAALKDNDSRVCQAAAGALGQLGDPQAVEPLIVKLSDDEGVGDVRTSAAQALVKFYSIKDLSPQHRQLILSKRDTITSPIHNFYGCDGSHVDTGIGVDFPL